MFIAAVKVALNAKEVRFRNVIATSAMKIQNNNKKSNKKANNSFSFVHLSPRAPVRRERMLTTAAVLSDEFQLCCWTSAAAAECMVK